MKDSSPRKESAGIAPPTLAGRVTEGASTLVGAGLALGLIIGASTWVYGVSNRDPGTIPIIRADALPAKMRPADPGGMVTAHRDMKSYEAAEQVVPVAAVSVRPGPPSPRPEDLSMGRLAEIAALSDGPASTAEPAAGKTLAPARVEAAPDDDTEKLEEKIIKGTKFAPAQSPMARRRPSSLMARHASAKSAVASGAQLVRQAETSAVQVQLWADPDESEVRSEWKRIYRANKDILGERALAVRTTKSGGKLYYHLRVGPFQDQAEARGVCQALMARGQDCIVAQNG